MRLLVLGLLLLVGCGGKENGREGGGEPKKDNGKVVMKGYQARGKYPPPTSKYNGWIATERLDDARDLNEGTCERACGTLHELKGEGIPYLLNATVYHHENNRAEHTMICLRAIEGTLLDPADYAVVEPFLSTKFSNLEDPWFQCQIAAVVIFRDAGPKAKKYLPEFRAIKKKLPKWPPIDPAIKEISK